jgi:hypothetical protein
MGAKRKTKSHHRPKLRRKTVNGKPRWVMEKITAVKNDVVTWTAPPQTDIAIWFPPGRDPLQVGTTILRSGESLTKFVQGVRKKLAKGHYYYSVFCFSDGTMAEGGSSPEMIVE